MQGESYFFQKRVLAQHHYQAIIIEYNQSLVLAS